MTNFLAILEFCAFYMKFKITKFTGINFCGPSQLLRFCKNAAKISSLPLLKITTISAHFLPVKKKIPILWIELQANEMQKVSKPYI